MSDAYRRAGVDVEAGYRAVNAMRSAVESTHNANVLPASGSFAGLYALSGYAEPVLVSGADGVGTKVELARVAGRLEGIGTDCVAMCVNDILCHGATPLFFLDYLAFDRLDADQAAAIVRGVAAGCREAGCALIGGETAEMPGVYAPGRFDVAGFAVGVVERSRLVGNRSARPGMRVIGLPSSGLHSNGFSLVRRLFPEVMEPGAGPGPESASESVALERAALRDLLLTPTRIYAHAISSLCAAVPVHGLAHITGGGWYENLPRMLPEGCALALDTAAVPSQPVFSLLAERGVSAATLYHTFNAGLGMAVIVAPDRLADALALLRAAGETPFELGEVIPGAREVVLR